jgi:hypothetical protein
MRQPTSWVPIAPLPPTAVRTALSGPALFAEDRLRDNDVLLRKGGRPTHGKARYFRFLQERAEEYASYKSPIDRRLLARELVDTWLCQGGRFCCAVGGPKEPSAASRPGKSTVAVATSTSRRDVFRVASTEEALQFTRRVLVRHFTPSVSKRARASNVSDAASTEPESDCSSTTCSEPSPSHPRGSAGTPPFGWMLHEDLCRRPCGDGVIVVDFDVAKCEAADALCSLRSTTTATVSHELRVRTVSPSSAGNAPPARVSPAIAF